MCAGAIVRGEVTLSLTGQVLRCSGLGSSSLKSRKKSAETPLRDGSMGVRSGVWIGPEIQKKSAETSLRDGISRGWCTKTRITVCRVQRAIATARTMHRHSAGVGNYPDKDSIVTHERIEGHPRTQMLRSVERAPVLPAAQEAVEKQGA